MDTLRQPYKWIKLLLKLWAAAFVYKLIFLIYILVSLLDFEGIRK